MDRSASSKLWLTTSEVSDLFGVTKRTIARWIDEKAMPGYRQPGKRGERRVLRTQLINFIQQRPEFQFALEILNGQPISVPGHNPAEGHKDDEGAKDRDKAIVWADAGLDTPDPDGAD